MHFISFQTFIRVEWHKSLYEQCQKQWLRFSTSLKLGKKNRCFLLTPKLLPNLEYSEACSILNIMNGPWTEQPSKGKNSFETSWLLNLSFIPSLSLNFSVERRRLLANSSRRIHRRNEMIFWPFYLFIFCFWTNWIFSHLVSCTKKYAFCKENIQVIFLEPDEEYAKAHFFGFSN